MREVARDLRARSGTTLDGPPGGRAWRGTGTLPVRIGF
jgi:hypothetical protein